MSEEGWIPYLKQEVGRLLDKLPRSIPQPPKLRSKPSAPPPPKPYGGLVLPKGYRIIKNQGKFIAQYKHRIHKWMTIGNKDFYEWSNKSDYYKYGFCGTITKAHEIALGHHKSKQIEVSVHEYEVVV